MIESEGLKEDKQRSQRLYSVLMMTQDLPTVHTKKRERRRLEDRKRLIRMAREEDDWRKDLPHARVTTQLNPLQLMKTKYRVEFDLHFTLSIVKKRGGGSNVDTRKSP
ncbi:hypothetical protein GLW03_12970 [Halobacillus halophilus]|nr:hypothetical protein [Halobacillus halophilus]